jgi:hypothetical protein
MCRLERRISLPSRQPAGEDLQAFLDCRHGRRMLDEMKIDLEDAGLVRRRVGRSVLAGAGWR